MRVITWLLLKFMLIFLRAHGMLLVCRPNAVLNGLTRVWIRLQSALNPQITLMQIIFFHCVFQSGHCQGTSPTPDSMTRWYPTTCQYWPLSANHVTIPIFKQNWSCVRLIWLTFAAYRVAISKVFFVICCCSIMNLRIISNAMWFPSPACNGQVKCSKSLESCWICQRKWPCGWIWSCGKPC